MRLTPPLGGESEAHMYEKAFEAIIMASVAAAVAAGINKIAHLRKKVATK